MACVEADGWRIADGATVLNTIAEQIRSAVKEGGREGEVGRAMRHWTLMFHHRCVSLSVGSHNGSSLAVKIELEDLGFGTRPSSPMPNGGTEKAEETR